MFFCVVLWLLSGGKSHMFVSSKSEVPTIKSQASLKSSQWLTSSKSSQGLIRVKSSHSIKQKQIYLCHTALFILFNLNSTFQIFFKYNI